MAESSLNLKLSELEAEVGFYLGWGRGTNFDEPAWDDRQQREIDRIVDRGLRMFYFPAPLPGDATSYDWSFLRPHVQLSYANASDPPVVALPDDFGGIEGVLRLIDANKPSFAIRVVPEAFVRRKYEELPDATGQPQYAAIEGLRGTTTERSTRAQLRIWPKADQDYTLALQYYLLPGALSGIFPYAYGGALHAETILAAVKAAAEQHQNGERGIEYAYFLERMSASVALDRRNKAQAFGYNGDPAYNRATPWGRSRHWYNQDVITFNGVEP